MYSHICGIELDAMAEACMAGVTTTQTLNLVIRHAGAYAHTV